MTTSLPLWPRRFAAQLLTGAKADSPEQVTSRLLAVQAQDLRGARLSVRSRSMGLHASDVDAAFGARRSLVVAWLNRVTLHMVCADDYWWLRQLTVNQADAANRRRLTQEGVTPDAATLGVRAIIDALADGPCSRAQLRQRIESAGVRTAGQALVHLLLAASIAEPIVRGPVVGAEQHFVLAESWLGPAPPALDADEALARLAGRYLTGHGPARAEDLARWSGLPLGAVRRGIAAAEGLELAGDGLWDVTRDETPSEPYPAPLLAGPFEPLLLGWVEREAITGANPTLVTSNGLFRPFALVEGRAIATWGLTGKKVTLHPFTELDPVIAAALSAEAAAVISFLTAPTGAV